MLQQCDRTKRHPATWQAVSLAKLREGGDSARHHSKPCEGRWGCSVCLGASVGDDSKEELYLMDG